MQHLSGSVGLAGVNRAIDVRLAQQNWRRRVSRRDRSMAGVADALAARSSLFSAG
jgi:hypothetical protein